LLLSALTGQTLSIATQESGTMLTSAQMGSVHYVGMIYHANGVVLKKKRLISSGEYWSCPIHHLTVSAFTG